MMRHPIPVLSTIILTIGLATGLTGCVTSPELTPAPTASTLGGETAVTQVEGVRVTAESDAWEAGAPISRQVTPVKVTIENDHGRAIRIRYSDFALVSPTGSRYAALPLYRIEGTVEEPTMAAGYPPLPAPGFYSRGFSVAPAYAPLYPNLAAAPASYYWDPYYNRRYTTYWQDIDLPTMKMRIQALPEGRIEDGGEVSGFIYFEKVDPETERVRFRLDLAEADDGTVFGTVTIPFRIED
jgi:hypothetical protein